MHDLNLNNFRVRIKEKFGLFLDTMIFFKGDSLKKLKAEKSYSDIRK